tara:strand:- start:4479 stop:6743 length:2265 start_codon:yes stop_codon:yes gene_type:complete
MTSSFTPQAQPVDTFVRPSTIAPTTGFDQLLRALETVNPGVQKYLDYQIKEEIKEEQAEGTELAIEDSVKGFKNITKAVKKKDGEDAARQLIGGSIFAQKAYERTKAEILARNVESKFNSSYATTQINGQPLSAYKFDSPEYQSWLNEQRSEAIDLLGDVNPTYVNKYFLPNLAQATSNITSEHLKKHQEYNFEQLKSLTSPLVTQVISIKDSAKVPLTDAEYVTGQAKQLINGFEQTIGDLGISGGDRGKINDEILDAIFDEAEAAAYEGDEERVSDIIDAAGLFPYGPGGQLSLKNHPDYKDKANEIERRVADYSYKIAKQKEIEDKRAKDKDVVDSLQKYAQALADGDPNANQIINELVLRQPEKAPKLTAAQSALDGDTRERYATLQRRIIDGDFDSEGAAAAEALAWFQDPRTPKTAANVKLFGDLIRYANQVGNGEFTEVNKYISEFNGLVNSRLRAGKSTFNIMGQVTGQGATIQGKYQNLFSDSFRRWKFSNPDASQEEIFDKYTELRDKYDQQLRDELKNPLGLDQDDQEDEKLEGVPDVSPLGDQSSNPIINAANQIANALTGTAPAAAGTLEEAQERGDLMIEEPQIITTGNGVERMENNFPTIYKLAKEVGIKFPEIVAAQFSLESDHGKEASGKNNYLGIKATKQEIADGKATLVQTTEVIDGKEVIIKDYFKDFDSLKDMLLHYKEQWNDNYKDRKGTITSSTVEEAIKLLKSNGYATDPNYVKKILNIIKSAKTKPALF